MLIEPSAVADSHVRRRRPFGANQDQPTARKWRLPYELLRDSDVGKPPDDFRSIFSGQLSSALKTWRSDARAQGSAARNFPHPALAR